MFFEYVYLDIDKVKQFGTYLGLKNDSITSGIKGKSAGAKIGAGPISTEIQYKDEKEYKVLSDDFSFFNAFKEKLKKETRYFVDSSDYVEETYISKLERGTILKFDGTLKVPEQFGQIDFIQNILSNTFTKELLMNEIDIKQGSDRAIFELFFGKNKQSKIPVYFEHGDYKMYSLLNREFLKVEDFSDFENLQNEEMTVYMKVEKVDNTEAEVEIIDMYKDVLGLNRAMRRGMNMSENPTFEEKITINGKKVKGSILAMLK